MAGRVNSCRKGKAGERSCAKFLRELGFESARRGQQHNGLEGDDVVCEELNQVHIEVKSGYPIGAFDSGKQKHEDAIAQSQADADDRAWCVLWRPKGYRHWRITFDGIPCRCTVVGDEQIKEVLLWLQSGA